MERKTEGWVEVCRDKGGNEEKGEKDKDKKKTGRESATKRIRDRRKSPWGKPS